MRAPQVLLLAAIVTLCSALQPASAQAKFKVLVVGQPDDNHPQTGAAGIKAVQELAAGQDYTVDAATDLAKFTDAGLAPYSVVICVMSWPGAWPASAQAAFRKYIESGKGWMGFHVSTLAGIYPTPWPWYDTWVGGITFKGHPGARQNGTIKLETSALAHPVMAGMPASFSLHEEWYSWTTSPRGKPNISILAAVDESSYDPQGTGMGADHPVIWSNTQYGPMILTSLCHEPEAFASPNIRKLLGNAIVWAAKSNPDAVRPSLAAPAGRETPVLRWMGGRLLFGGVGDAPGPAFGADGRALPRLLVSP